MMTDLWILAALLVISGMLTVLWPIWRARRQRAVDRAALNVALYQERVQELDAQVQAGDLTEAQRDATLEEASRLLLDDTALADSQQGTRRRGSPWLLVAAAGVLPLVVAALYAAWGNPAGLALARELEEGPPPATLEESISRMERMVQVQPENGEAWYMLGRGYINAQEFDLAVLALGNSLERLGERPEVLAQLAQARYFAAGNELDAPSVAALDKALELDPQEPTALGLLGIAAFESGDYQGAIDFWQRLLAGMPADSPGAQTIQGGIQRAQQRLSAGADAAPIDATAVIRIQLELGEGIAEQMGEDAVLFVFARDPQGPPMPLAARRFRLSELPVEVDLSPADAMLPEARLSAGQRVQLIARLSPDGDAMQGSHEAKVDDVRVGAEQRILLRVEQPLP